MVLHVDVVCFAQVFFFGATSHLCEKIDGVHVIVLDVFDSSLLHQVHMLMYGHSIRKFCRTVYASG
jgi:hypothetical protein